MKKSLLLLMLCTLFLVSCSRATPSNENLNEVSSSAEETTTPTTTETDETKMEIPSKGISLIKNRVDKAKIVGNSFIFGTMAEDPDPYVQAETADLIIIGKATKLIDTKFTAANAPFPISYLNVEIIKTIKGTETHSVKVGVLGGTVDLNTYMEHQNLKSAEIERWQTYSKEERADMFVEMYLEDFIDIENEKPYLFILSYDKDNDAYVQRLGGYSTYEINLETGDFRNALSETSYNEKELSKN